MKNQNNIALFEGTTIRRVWDEKKEKWYFSIVDIIAILTESPRPRKYWNALKTKLLEEGSELSQNVGQLKLQSSDGKKYDTDVADVETIMRLVQSIPSKKAEPIKLWLAKVGYEDPAQKGGRIAKNARRELEDKTGKSVVSKNSYLPLGKNTY